MVQDQVGNTIIIYYLVYGFGSNFYVRALFTRPFSYMHFLSYFYRFFLSLVCLYYIFRSCIFFDIHPYLYNHPFFPPFMHFRFFSVC